MELNYLVVGSAVLPLLVCSLPNRRNGWALKKHSMVMVQRCQNHQKAIEVNGGLKKNINHSIALKNLPSLWSSSYATNILSFPALQEKVDLAPKL